MLESLMWKAVRALAGRALPRAKEAFVRAGAPPAVVKAASARNRTLMLAGAALAVTALMARRRAAKRGPAPRP